MGTALFGTDGIRGKAGELLTASFALQVGFCTGMVWRETHSRGQTVIVGQDSRNSSDTLAMAIAAGLTSAGLEVSHLGLCTTPCVAYLTRNTDAVGGIMISASHNPPEDNGIKIFASDGTKLTKTLTQAIEAGLRETHHHHESVKASDSWGKYYHRPSLTKNYLQSLWHSLTPQINLAGMRIVLDLAWGASVKLAPVAFTDLGAEVICLHEQADGDRINVNCGSTHLTPLQQAVQAHQADLGFAFDGDGDRVMAVDAQGRIIDGDYILYFWGNHLKQQQKLPENLLIGTVMANLGFELAWKQLGGQLIRTPVGDQHVQAEMWRTGAMLGGEQSGHIICHHYGVSGDGLQTALHLTSLVSQSSNTLAELVDGSFQTYPQLLRNVRVTDRDRRLHWQNCEPLQQAIKEAQTTLGTQGRVLVRASGTEPVIRVMVEASEAEPAQYWTEKLVLLVQENLAK